MLPRLLLAIATPVALTASLPVMAQTQAPPVTINTGAIAGVAEGELTVFRGIPYAAPPVGPLRWKAPQPALRWSGVRAARSFGAACPQDSAHKESWAQVGPMSEDCLFLNVWRPSKPGRYPVMVFLHGGGFTYGVPSYSGTPAAP